MDDEQNDVAAATEGIVDESRTSKLAVCGKLLACGVALAGVAAAVRQFIATRDSGWQAPEPSSPYVSPSTENIVEDIADDIETDSAAE